MLLFNLNKDSCQNLKDYSLSHDQVALDISAEILTQGATKLTSWRLSCLMSDASLKNVVLITHMRVNSPRKFRISRVNVRVSAIGNHSACVRYIFSLLAGLTWLYYISK